MNSSHKSLLRILLLLLLSGVVARVHGQQRPITSQYIFDGLLLNPAYAGSHVQLSTTLLHRNQWVNLDGAPKSNVLTTHVAVADNRVGLGLYVIDDQIGVHKELSIYGSYAYKIRFPNATLSLGIQGGFNNRRSSFTDLNLQSVTDGYFQNIRVLKPNFGTGAYFHTSKYFIGLSVPFLLNNDILEFNEGTGTVENVKETRNYYLTGGVMVPLNMEETIRLMPSALVRSQEGSPLNFDVSMNLILYDVISVGGSYRNIEGMVSFINIKILDNLYLGYGYDWTQSDLNRFSNGSHEFILNYRVRLRGIHKPLECPSYYSIR